MSGLRERQKQMRRQAIAKAATELFHRQGFHSTTLDQIAAQAGVSQPTVCKYFGSKQEILLELLKDDDQRVFLEFREQGLILQDPVDCLCYLEHATVEHALKVMPAALWRELLPLILAEEGEGLPQAYQRMNDFLLQQIAGVLREMQARGIVRQELDVDQAATLLSEYTHLLMLRLTQSDSPDMDGHRLRVRGFVELVFYGMRNPDHTG